MKPFAPLIFSIGLFTACQPPLVPEAIVLAEGTLFEEYFELSEIITGNTTYKATKPIVYIDGPFDALKLHIIEESRTLGIVLEEPIKENQSAGRAFLQKEGNWTVYNVSLTIEHFGSATHYDYDCGHYVFGNSMEIIIEAPEHKTTEQEQLRISAPWYP